MSPRDAAVGLLLAAFDEAFDRPSWHGPNLRGSIRGLTPARAARRPGRGRHNIQEVVVHCAYWKYAVWRLLTRARRGTFELDGTNWFPRPRADARLLRADIELLARWHRELRQAITALPPGAVRKQVKSRVSVADVIRGATAHDLYHAGQIQLIKRLT